MKFSCGRWSFAWALSVIVAAWPLRAAEPPNKKTLSADLKRLDALDRVFTKTQAQDDQFGATFWRASKHLADERGPAIIDAVMVLSHRWHDEAGLVYVPLVALLPRGRALVILRRYQHSKIKAERVWAGEFTIEFGMTDTRAAVARFSAHP